MNGRLGKPLYARSEWHHKKRGTGYFDYGIGTLQTSRPLQDGDELVVYVDDKGRIWLRPPEEMTDGRFTGGPLLPKDE